MKHIKLIILTVTIPFLLNSCGAIVKGSASKKMTVENGAIPADFGKDDTVLICVLKGRNSRDNYMRKHIKKNYKGKYEFVLQSDVYSHKYDDRDKYRYLFDYNAGSMRSTSYSNLTGEIETRHLPTSSYYIMDRKSNEYYFSNISSGFFSKLIQAYSINMEKVRLSNQ
ncbi:hypothetical protein [Winogradskyella sp. 3972H.M.0a.05]|uniref:hypothetical protein n=1 Tax=Winogradskyella sp. 3972H.M.0a.05 TaxID=2950277 RepID=UPI003394C399